MSGGRVRAARTPGAGGAGGGSDCWMGWHHGALGHAEDPLMAGFLIRGVPWGHWGINVAALSEGMRAGERGLDEDNLSKWENHGGARGCRVPD